MHVYIGGGRVIIGALKGVLYMEAACIVSLILSVLCWKFHCISWFNSNHGALSPCVSERG